MIQKREDSPFLSSPLRPPSPPYRPLLARFFREEDPQTWVEYHDPSPLLVVMFPSDFRVGSPLASGGRTPRTQSGLVSRLQVPLTSTSIKGSLDPQGSRPPTPEVSCSSFCPPRLGSYLPPHPSEGLNRGDPVKVQQPCQFVSPRCP